MHRGHRSRPALCLIAASLALVVAGSAQARGSSGGTFVFGIDADPIALDAALAVDINAHRVVNQMLEGLVELAPGSARVVPKLATSWKTNSDGRTWTFFLRRGVKFHDGTPFNAAAVCFNFERWYGFKGSLQGAAYLWLEVFGGFRRPEPGTPAKSLYRRCERVDDHTVRLRLTRRTTSFLAPLAEPEFGIASPTALRRYAADAGEADANGVFHPAGTYGLEHPTGTGPFMFKSWQPGREVVLVRNPGYWGRKAKLDRLIFRTIADRTARVRALERGTIQGLDQAITVDADTIKRNPQLKLLDVPSGNTGWVGINQAIPPMNKLLVRQAIAYGLDRVRVVRSFYGGRGRLADQFLAARQDRLLVPDRHLAAVHARSEAQLRSVRRESGESRLRRRPAQRSLAPRLLPDLHKREGAALPGRLARRLSGYRQLLRKLLSELHPAVRLQESEAVCPSRASRRRVESGEAGAPVRAREPPRDGLPSDRPVRALQVRGRIAAERDRLRPRCGRGVQRVFRDRRIHLEIESDLQAGLTADQYVAMPLSVSRSSAR